MKQSIDVTENELAIIANILKDRPDVVVFGSRIKGTSKRFSDLDLCLKAPISDYEYELLKEAFEKSDLPFKVDLVDYSKIDGSFKKIIDQEGIKFLVFIKNVQQSVLPRYKNELISIIHSYLPGCTIYLFGSRAIGKERPGSDIDLAVDMTFLGYDGDPSLQNITKLRKASYAFTRDTLCAALNSKLTEKGFIDFDLKPKEEPNTSTDPHSVEIHYKSLVESTDYVDPMVRLEVGARSQMEPSEQTEIQSFVGKHFAGKAFADKPSFQYNPDAGQSSSG